MAQLDVYRRALGLPHPISPIIVRAVFNAIPRPAFWHGGQGEATVRLRQRGTLAIDNALRLHESWIVIAVPSPTTLYDPSGQPMGNGSWLVLVIEANGALPLAVWPCADPPTLREVGLAIYRAIWHPGAENYPVKGLPEQLRIHDALMVGDRHDLDCAASYLLCDVLVQPRVKLLSPEVRTLVRKVTAGIKSALEPLAHAQRTSAQVAETLERWIEERFFLGHRAAPVWSRIAQHGVVMPGHDTPGAGWLLPTSGQAKPEGERIYVEGIPYRYPGQAWENDVFTRRFPWYYPERDDGVFVHEVFEKFSEPIYVKRQG